MVLFQYTMDNARKQIVDIDDIKAEIDNQKLKEIEIKQRIGGEIKNQQQVKTKLEEQIATQKIVLNELVKAAQLKSSANEASKKAKKGGEEEEEPDYDAQLESLKQNLI